MKDSDTKRYLSSTSHPLHTTPRHIAFIMDGNGRWASERHKPIQDGHQAGLQAMERVIKAVDDFGIAYLTLYIFSTENWHRPQDEVSFIMAMLEDNMQPWGDKLLSNNCRLRTIGHLETLSPSINHGVKDLVTKTEHNTGMTLTLAVNYGGRDEILRAAQLLANDSRQTGKSPSDYSIDDFASFLDTHGLPELDLLVRSGGDMRISNFLLWQSAYTEFVFMKENWPDFDQELVYRALLSFQSRKRRFGGR